jgi:Domain of unknown function (DUF397)
VTDATGLRWRKSSASAGNGECVELAALDDGRVAVRDSKNPDGAMLIFTRAEMRAWVQGVRAGEFDDLI